MTRPFVAAPAADLDLTIVCPVGPYSGDLAAVHEQFHRVLARPGWRLEFVFVLDGPNLPAEESLGRIAHRGSPVRVFRMARVFGEATALQFAFLQARGRFVLTIPDRFQVEPEGAREVVARLEAGDEVVVTRREPRVDPLLNRLQSRGFHALVRRLSGHDFRDMTCGLRGFRRETARRLNLYGDLHRFIPVLAAQAGHRITEVPVRQRREDVYARVFGPGVYARRLLDVLQVFFLTRFTRKPLRFFGTLGACVGTVGFVISAVLAVLRLIGRIALSDRPLLLLGILLMVLGVQLVSIGLIGEIVIFLSTRQEEPDVTELQQEEP